MAQWETNATRGASPDSRGQLERLGEWCARRPWRIVLAWVLGLGLLGALAGSMHPTFSDNVTLDGTQAATGLEVLNQNFPSSAVSSGLVVLHSSTSLQSARRAVDSTLSQLSHVSHVISVGNPWQESNLSANSHTALVTLSFDVASRALDAPVLRQLTNATASAVRAGVSVNFGGGLSQLTQPQLNDLSAEELGFAIALLVLLLVFGSVAGAVLPLATALASIAGGVFVLDVVGAHTPFGASAQKLTIMIGLGVGIDYAVFLTTRFRQLLHDGVDPVHAAGLTTRTSGRAILVAAATVSIAMLGLYASGLVFIGKLGLAAVFGVVTAALGAVTLVPSGLGLLGRRIDRWRVRRPVAEMSTAGGGWQRYALAIGRHPWRYLSGGLVVLAILAAPALSLQMGHVGDGAAPANYTSRVAYNEVAAAFGAGENGPFTIVVQLRDATSSTSLATTLQHDLAASPGVARVAPFTPSANGRALVSTLVPATGPQSSATANLFSSLVDQTLPRILAPAGARGYVTGETPSQIQFDLLIARRIPLIIGVVVLLAFLLIMTVFRSLFLALKAAILNLCSVAAAYGVLVAVFQWGWGRALLGLKENVPIEAYVPMVLFAIVFGLSMDYEIFLLSRVRETWMITHRNHDAVAEGLARTARVITAAALIMIAVFLSFVSSDLVAIKQLALGLAASVAIDATLVRLLLVPATMYLFGEKNWWLPRPLERVVPHLSVD